MLGALLIGAPAPVAAQYFGRNKVQYEKFDFRILRIVALRPCTSIPPNRSLVHDAAAWPSDGTRATRTASGTRSIGSR